MNILIASESFLSGGLETQIRTTIDSLKDKNNFYFAISRYNSAWKLENVFTGFYFSCNSTISQFCSDVHGLIKIIQENNIDIIHVHPFFSFFPAVFAAKICNRPVVYTYHGVSSYSFTTGINDNILFNLLLDYEVDKVFCVSKEGKQVIENIVLNKDKIHILPNSIDTNTFTETKINSNKSWALISRLDTDKLNELNTLLTAIPLLDINELHIYGSGTEEEKIKNIICQNNLDTKVFIEGYSNRLYNELKNKYNGIFAIGRSAMEALSMGYPVMLLGYNKFSGLITDEIYSQIKYENFSNKLLPCVSIEKLNNQIKNVYSNSYNKSFYTEFKNEFDSKVISNNYQDELLNINPSSTLNLEKLFYDIMNSNNDELFYDSQSVFNIFRSYFLLFCRHPHQKELFIIGDNIINNSLIKNHSIQLENNISDFETSLSNFENKLVAQDKKFYEFETKLIDIKQNTMTINNLKRKIKYKFKH